MHNDLHIRHNIGNHHKLKMVGHKKRFKAAMFPAVFGLFGIIAVIGVVLAAPLRRHASVEVENGVIVGEAKIENDSASSSGRYLSFTPTATTPPPPPPPPSTTRRFPGDPNPKVYNKAYWGSSYEGGDPTARHETPTGVSLSVRRTFFDWSEATNTNNGKLYSTVVADHSKNRLPFVSIKTPGWQSVANGSYDSQLDAILRKLDSYGKPVWFAAHHEPEGGADGGGIDDPGGAVAWRAMQQRIRARMKAVGTKNVAFMAILMSYTWNQSSGRTPSDWWVDNTWDAYCADHYHDNTTGSPLKAQWYSFVSFAESKNIPFCIAEWGNRGTDAQAAQEMRDFWNWSFNNKKDMLAYTYFDSGRNSPSGTWMLSGEPLATFHDILKNDTRVQRINNL